MKNLLYLAIAPIVALLAACGGAGEPNRTTPAVNPFVDAFTSGSISRTAPVFLVFSEEVPEADRDVARVPRWLKIKPSVDGEFAFDNGRTVVFRPAGEFKRGTEYTVTADIGAVFDAKKEHSSFSFSFSTLPIAVRAELEGIAVSGDKEGAYDVKLAVRTPDRETSETVRSLVAFSENVEAEWTEGGDGHNHGLVLRGVEGGNGEARTITLSVGANKLGAERGDILTVAIPDRNAFSVYDVAYVASPEKFISVTFTHNLDPSQNMRGLAWIVDNENETVEVEGNVLKLFPDDRRGNTVTVRLGASIRSANGHELGEDVEREVEIDSEVPAVEFVGEGTIIPDAQQLMVPFRAVWLRGVKVRVIRVMENNMGMFMQSNNVDGSDELARVGRLVALKTVWLDEQGGDDFSSWKTYALDLRRIIEPEQGAIYRVVLTFDRDLSAYPCEGIESRSKERVAADDEVAFKAELEQYYDNAGDYYYSDYIYYEYDGWNYRDDEGDPCSNRFYRNTVRSRNVLASNLGVVAKQGEGNEVIAAVHNIVTTKPESGVTVAIYNYQNQQIGSAVTGADGQARVAFGGGRPFYLKASAGKQRSYVRLDAGSALSTSSFDVAGQTVQKGVKGFIYGDRGVWRPGDVMYLGFMLNDRTGALPADMPVVMELYNPMGQQVQRKTQTDGRMGVYAFEMATEADAPTGSWEVRVLVGGATFSKRVRVETVKPNRLKIDLTFDRSPLSAGEPVAGKLHTEWLTGAVARGLKYDIDGTFTQSVTVFPKFEGWVFSDPSKKFESTDIRVAEGTVDEQGNAVIGGSIDIGSSAPGMLAANLVTRVYEESGDFSLDGMRVTYSPYKRYVGVHSPQKSGSGQLATGRYHRFEVASVDWRGNPLGGQPVKVTIYKVSWYWWWSSSNGRLANYISDSDNSPVETKNLTTGADGKAAFELNYADNAWGTYFIRVEDGNGTHTAGLMAYFDWPDSYRRGGEGSDAADKLSLKTDKDTYAPGETMTVTVPSSVGSRAMVSVENGSRVLSLTDYECGEGETAIKIEVTDEMMPNVYVHVTLLQPHGGVANDLPVRLYGVVPVTVTSPRSHLRPELKIADEIKPEERYEFTVSEGDCREMAYTVAIVDEGLLDLTRFRTPDPWVAFNAREALGVTTWDLYSYVVGAYGGRIEQLFSIGGGEEADAGPKAIVNRFKPVVQFAGPFTLKKGERRKHSYDMPNYNGRVRVMVVAGDGHAYGSAEKSVLVRKPVMLLGTLPRVIGTGEEMTVPATVFATKEGVGNVDVTVECSDNMEVVGPRKQTLNFTAVGDRQATFRIRTGAKPGAGKVTLTARAKGEQSVWDTEIELRSVRRPQVKVVPVTLTPGQTWSQNVALHGADGTNRVTLEVSDVPPVNIASRLSYLIGYPHGCIEQITSKAFPQLYVGQFAALTAQQAKVADEAVKETLRRYKSYQIAGGAFAYWPGSSDGNGWGSVYATHFMLEAEAKGYLVAENMKNAALNNLSALARGWRSADGYYRTSERTTQAYRLYVLALGKRAEAGAMNRLREEKDLAPAAKWMLAAAYARMGRPDVARDAVGGTTPITDAYDYEYDLTYGSSLRDRAVQLMALVMMDNAAEAAATSKYISDKLSSDDWLSTQSTAYALMAMSAYMNRYGVADKMEFGYTFGGKREQQSTDKSIWSSVLAENAAGGTASLELRNPGKATLFARVVVEGTPAQGAELAYSQGVTLTAEYQDRRGGTLDVAALGQGTDVVAVVRVSNPTGKIMRNLVLTQIVPAGWEILNTRYMNDGAGDSNGTGVSYQDIRDDRVYTYIDYMPAGKHVTVRLNLAATYGGRFYMPPVWVEAMYDNLTRANTEGRDVEVK